MDAALRWLMFRLDAESAHEFAARQMRRLQSVPLVLEGLERCLEVRDERLVRSLWGLRFENPLGIAAGFDKNAELVPFLCALGFGFIEVGTVTLFPQPGNPKPRLFRYPAHQALVNRLGFNNQGATVVRQRLEGFWMDSVAAGRRWRPLFVNIGKNRDVPLDAAVEAYAMTYRRLAAFADGIVVNVSSPNTPSLRDLQRPENLARILDALRSERRTTSFVRPGDHPILVKIAPDLERVQLEELMEVCVRLADGVVATNTTADHEGLLQESDQSGGLSGRPLFSRSTSILRQVRQLAGAGYPLIGVGGIGSLDDARAKLEAGADLLQVYTGFIYGGARFPRRLLEGLIPDAARARPEASA